MADELVPDDLREFILRHLDSVAELEALLLLRANAGQDWDLAKIAKRLHTSERDVAEGLARLCHDGFLACHEGIFRYGCHADEQRRMVDRLSEFYARHLIPVTNIIHSKPRRVREFADAFKFRRDP